MDWTPVITALVPSVVALIGATVAYLKSRSTANTVQTHLEIEHGQDKPVPPDTAGL